MQKYATLNEYFSIRGYTKWLILCTFNIIFTLPAKSQLQPVPSSEIMLLKQGVLLVKLRSYHRKIDYIKEKMQASNCQDDCRRSYEKLLQNTYKERDSFNIPFVYWMKNRFNFCKVYFFYDADYSDWRKSDFRKKIWLNDKLEKDDSIELSDTSRFLILHFENSPEQNQHVMIFTTREDIKIPKPFPYLREHHTKTLLVPLTHNNEQYHRTGFILADMLNKKLFNYYEKVYQKKWKDELYR